MKGFGLAEVKKEGAAIKYNGEFQLRARIWTEGRGKAKRGRWELESRYGDDRWQAIPRVYGKRRRSKGA